jgi:4-amino-4-deoxy-L-arabinose transferase-like glycosyltransferase
MNSDTYVAPVPRRITFSLPRPIQRLMALPELLGVLAVAGVLNLWGLSINGWANTYYSAAVRSMASSWHNFLYASMDPSGLMTVDKPPLALWVQALSVRVFGYDPLAILVPQALMGVAAAAIAYDIVRRRFGRFAGFVGGVALATTPTIVAVSRHNNPDELLVLCTVAALWFALRALETGRTRHLVWAGVFVGLGFETKMAVALMVVPGIVAAYMWVAPRMRGRLDAFKQLVAGGGAMAAVGLAWPLLVTLTPAADRPWISGTSDNSIWSLIFSYNGLGRLSGQTGGPQSFGGGGTMFGGPTGVFRLLQTGLGDQAGWLLGFAVVSGLGLLVASRLRRGDARAGWLMVVGGAFLTTAVAFSVASGIFHPYYVSFLAPFTALLIGAGVGQMTAGGLAARIVGPAAIAGGAITELVVLGNINGALSWARPLLIGIAGACAVLLAMAFSTRVRRAVVAVAVAVLFAAPATWAAETIAHATSGTFPTGGPASAAQLGGGPGGPGGHGGFRGPGGGFAPPGGAGFAPGAGSGFAPPTAGAFQGGGAGSGGRGFAGGPGGVGAGGAFGGEDSSLKAVINYVNAHGGGTIGVESQSSAAASIVSSHANIAGLGGFSGRESSVSVAWLANEVQTGHLRWVLADSTGMPSGGTAFGTSGGRGPGADTRTGSQSALTVVASTCKATTVSGVKLYDCQGKAAALLSAAQGSTT